MTILAVQWLEAVRLRILSVLDNTHTHKCDIRVRLDGYERVQCATCQAAMFRTGRSEYGDKCSITAADNDTQRRTLTFENMLTSWSVTS